MAEDTQELIKRIRAARKTGGRIRLLFGLVVLGLFVFFGQRIYQTFTGFDQKAFMVNLDRQVTKTVWPAITFELERVVRESSPILAKRFAERVEADWPKFEQVLEAQVEKLGKNMEGKSEKVVAAFVDETAKKVAPQLVDAFPEVKDDAARQKALAGKVQDRMRTWAAHQYGQAVESHVKALLDIKKTLESFKPKEGSKISADDVLALTLEVLEVRLDGKTAAPKPPKKGG